MKIGRLRYLIAGLSMSVVINCGVHMYNTFWSGFKAAEDGIHMLYTPETGWKQSPKVEALMNFQRISMDEILISKYSIPNPWLLVPGSFLWRAPEKPDLESLSSEPEIPEKYKKEKGYTI